MASNEKTLEKTLKVYDFIKQFAQQNGFPPSIRDICTALNISSTATVSYYVNKLDEMGYIKKLKNKNRAMEILSDNQSGEIKIHKIQNEDFSYDDEKNVVIASKILFDTELPNCTYKVTADDDLIQEYGEGDYLFLKKNDYYPVGSKILCEKDGKIIVKLLDEDLKISGENSAENIIVYGKIIKVLKEIK